MGNTHRGERVKSGLIENEFDLSAPTVTMDFSENRAIGNAWPRSGHRILCVDDDAVGLRCRGELFEELGYSVVLCHSPSDALRCDLSAFDLGLLDFHLPDLNGRELLLRMRAAGAKFPIFLLTGYLGSLSHEDRVLFTRCFDKAEPVQRLLHAIARLLDPQQLPDYGA